MRTTSDEARRAIAEAAVIVFCKRGYSLATLEEIGAEVGLTRGAVLHHFKSKAGLLAAVVDPCRQAVAQFLITPAPLEDPPTLHQRRQLLTRIADLFIEHHAALGLLANDISARVQLGLDDQCFIPRQRLVSLLLGSNADHANQVRVAAAMGAIIQPVTWAWVDLGDGITRAGLIESAVAVLRESHATSYPNRNPPPVPSTLRPVPLPRVAAL